MGKVIATQSVDLDAGETIQNALAGTKLENVPTDANYRLVLLASATSLDVEHSLSVDTDEAVQPSIVGDNGRKPIEPDDIVDVFKVEGGSKLYYTVSNNDGSTAHTLYYTLKMIPLS